MLLAAEKSQLFVVDLQERLLPAVQNPTGAVANAAILLKAAERLGVPVTITEQYPDGIGHTVAELTELVPKAKTFAKRTFASSADKGIRAHAHKLKKAGRDQLVICGTEAHVCVLQSALGFAEAGWRVAVVVDAVSSRATVSKETAVARLAMAGVHLVTTEMVVFEWVADSRSPAFRDLLALVK